MPRLLAKFISYIFHPLLFSTYATICIILAIPHLFGNYTPKAQGLWVILVFLLTFIFPVVWLLMMKKLQLVSSLELDDKKERIIPYIATATFYMWTYRMFHPSPSNVQFSNELISIMLLGAAISIFIGFFINIFLKVSLHAIGVGSFFAVTLIILKYSDYNLTLLIIGSIIVAGVVGSARVALGAHEPKEVFLGYLVGFTGQFIAFNVIPMFA
jgi:membrane-associated phospholipid phosphatase